MNSVVPFATIVTSFEQAFRIVNGGAVCVGRTQEAE